jgi:hypothetical protein
MKSHLPRSSALPPCFGYLRFDMVIRRSAPTATRREFVETRTSGTGQPPGRTSEQARLVQLRQIAETSLLQFPQQTLPARGSDQRSPFGHARPTGPHASLDAHSWRINLSPSRPARQEETARNKGDCEGQRAILHPHVPRAQRAQRAQRAGRLQAACNVQDGTVDECPRNSPQPARETASSDQRDVS